MIRTIQIGHMSPGKEKATVNFMNRAKAHLDNILPNDSRAMRTLTLVLCSLAFLLPFTGCSTAGSLYHVRERSDQDSGITTFEMVFYREREMEDYETWQTAIDTLEIRKFIKSDEEDAYTLSVIYEGGSVWKYYDHFIVVVDESRYEFLDTDPVRENIFGGKVMEIATVWLSDECVDALRTCRTLEIQVGQLLANVSPEGINEIQSFIEQAAGE